jgi:hypothetical protein
MMLDPDDLSAAEFYADEESRNAQQSIDQLEQLLAWGVHENAAYRAADPGRHRIAMSVKRRTYGQGHHT